MNNKDIIAVSIWHLQVFHTAGTAALMFENIVSCYTETWKPTSLMTKLGTVFIGIITRAWACSFLYTFRQRRNEKVRAGKAVLCDKRNRRGKRDQLPFPSGKTDAFVITKNGWNTFVESLQLNSCLFKPIQNTFSLKMRSPWLWYLNDLLRWLIYYKVFWKNSANLNTNMNCLGKESEY